ncbi:hypothetical protein V6Z11_A11G273900 [Gossypium hirsutum]
MGYIQILTFWLWTSSREYHVFCPSTSDSFCDKRRSHPSMKFCTRDEKMVFAVSDHDP